MVLWLFRRYVFLVVVLYIYIHLLYIWYIGHIGDLFFQFVALSIPGASQRNPSKSHFSFGFERLESNLQKRPRTPRGPWGIGQKAIDNQRFSFLHGQF